MLLDGDHLACQLRRLAPGRRADVERALAFTRADREPCQRRAAALRPDAAVLQRDGVHAWDAEYARRVGPLAFHLASHKAHRGLGRVVLRVHERDRLLVPEVALPDFGDPVRVRKLERPVGKRIEQGSQAVRQAPQHGIRERHGALQPRTPHELDALVHGRMSGNAVEIGKLIRAHPERGQDGRIELADGPPAERLDAVVERPSSLHRAEGDLLSQRPVALVELAAAVAKARSAYASCSNTRRTTSYAARRAGVIELMP